MIVLKQSSLEGELELLNQYANHLDECLNCIRALQYYESEKYVQDTLLKELSLVHTSAKLLENQIDNTECIEED